MDGEALSAAFASSPYRSRLFEACHSKVRPWTEGSFIAKNGASINYQNKNVVTKTQFEQYRYLLSTVITSQVDIKN